MTNTRTREAAMLRDVGTSTLANLIAAVIIYVIGVVFGFFPRLPGLATILIVAPLFLSMVVLVGVSDELRRPWKQRALSAGFFLGGIAMSISGLFARGQYLVASILFLVGSVGCFAFAAGVENFRRKEERRAAWKMMSWYVPSQSASPQPGIK